MARGRRSPGGGSARSIPGALSQGKHVFPITRFGARLENATVGAAANEVEVVNLNLQFEDNEVFDIWSMEYNVYFDTNDVATFTDLVQSIGVFEDPDKPVTTDLITEATVETDTSLIHIWRCGITWDLATTGMAWGDNTFTYYFQFPQPYTVARNIAIIAQINGTEGDTVSTLSTVSMWGRRRDASDAEFKNIIYRQRF